jgi:hypothetical protein
LLIVVVAAAAVVKITIPYPLLNLFSLTPYWCTNMSQAIYRRIKFVSISNIFYYVSIYRCQMASLLGWNYRSSGCGGPAAAKNWTPYLQSHPTAVMITISRRRSSQAALTTPPVFWVVEMLLEVKWAVRTVTKRV